MRRTGLTYALAAGGVLLLPGTAVVALQAARVGDTAPAVVDEPVPQTPPATALADRPGETAEEPESVDADDGDGAIEVVWDDRWLEDFDLDESSFEIDWDDLADLDDEAIAAELAEPTEPVSPIIDALSASGVPEVALRAYVNAEATMARTDPSCGVSWSLLAAIGRVESNHGRYGGAQLREDGSTTPAIRGLPLDGGPGVALILDTDNGRYDADRVYDRAVGPMQFIPSTWGSVGADGNGNGIKDPNNIYDAALGSAAYLCSGGGDLTDDADRRAAVYRYNRSTEYVNMVLSLAEAYENGRGGDLPDPDTGGSTASQPSVPSVPDTVEEPASVGVPAGLSDRGASASGASSNRSDDNAERAADRGGSSKRPSAPRDPSEHRSLGRSVSRSGSAGSDLPASPVEDRTRDDAEDSTDPKSGEAGESSSNASGDSGEAIAADPPEADAPSEDVADSSDSASEESADTTAPDVAEDAAVADPTESDDASEGAAPPASEGPTDESDNANDPGNSDEVAGETPSDTEKTDDTDTGSAVESDEVAVDGEEIECSAVLDAIEDAIVNEELDSTYSLDSVVECCRAAEADDTDERSADSTDSSDTDMSDEELLLECCVTDDSEAGDASSSTRSDECPVVLRDAVLPDEATTSGKDSDDEDD